jgi:Flp pilus assembly protein TadG
MTPFLRAQRLTRRFLAERRGSAAVEFAFVALPFLTLLFAVLELGMVFLVSTTLQNAADAAGRKIRTGELQATSGTAATFKAAICAEMTWLGSDCSTNLLIDVRTYSNFTSVVFADPVTNGVVDPTKTQFQPGNAEDIVVVRVYYVWTLFTPLLNTCLKTLSGGKRLISSTVTFRNEPWAT